MTRDMDCITKRIEVNRSKAFAKSEDHTKLV